MQQDRNEVNIRLQPNAKLRDQLQQLARWRIDQSLIAFPGDTPELRGGSAIVSQAFLALPSDPGGNMDESKHFVKDGSGSDIQNPQLKESEKDSHEHQAMQGGKRGDEEEKRDSGDQTVRRKVVAVKKMKMKKDQGIDRVLGLALRESEFLLQLSHPNIIELEGFVEDVSRNVVWLIFPWEENGTLRDFLASEDWEIPERISLIDDVTKGVEYLHTRKPPICHGDLKSLNILVNSKYYAVITDFGSAHHLDNEDFDEDKREDEVTPSSTLNVDLTDQTHTPLQAIFCPSTNTLTLTGNKYTIRWAAPELLMANHQRLESDIWALGWIAYEVMTNSIPFHDVMADIAVVKRVIRGDLPCITKDVRMSLIRALCSLMAQCWSIDPTERPTAEDCRKSISWMPMILPARLTDAGASRVRYGELLNQLGDMYKRQGNYTDAANCFTEALNVYANDMSSTGRADALWGLADVHRHRDEYAKAIVFYSEALHICTDIGDRRRRANALWGLGEVYRLRDEYKEATIFYSEALQLRTEADDRGGRAEALWGLAEVHRLLYEYDQAVTFYSETLQICTEIRAERGRADALWGLATVHQRRNKYSEAIKLYSEALQICTEAGDQNGRANALCGLADVFKLQDKCSDAIALYSETLQIRVDIGDRQGRADALWGMAEVQRGRGDYSEATRLYSDALQIFTETGVQSGRADSLVGLATIQRLQSKYSEAIILYSQALQTCTAIGSEYRKARALLGLAEVHLDQDHQGDAMSFYTQAVEVLKRIGDPEEVANALKDASNVHTRFKGAARCPTEIF